MAQGGQTPEKSETGDALASRMLRHASFAMSVPASRNSELFADARLGRLQRSQFVQFSSLTLAPRALAVEVGLRYLPLAASLEFRPMIEGAQDLYPHAWANLLGADLLWLFADEEEYLAREAWRASSAATAARSAISAAPRPTPVAAQRPRPEVPKRLLARARRIAELSKRVDSVVPGLSKWIRESTGPRAYATLPIAAKERAWVAIERSELIKKGIDTAAFPTVSPQQYLGLDRDPRMASAPPAITSLASPSRMRTTEPPRSISRRARSPYPSGIGQVAAFSTMISLKPALTHQARPIGAAPVASLLQGREELEPLRTGTHAAMSSLDTSIMEPVRLMGFDARRDPIARELAASAPVGQLSSLAAKQAQTATGAPLSQPATGAPLSQPATGAPLSQPATGAPLSQPATGAPLSQPATGAPLSQLSSSAAKQIPPHGPQTTTQQRRDLGPVVIDDIALDSRVLSSLATSLLSFVRQTEKLAKGVQIASGPHRSRARFIESLDHRTGGGLLSRQLNTTDSPISSLRSTEVEDDRSQFVAATGAEALSRAAGSVAIRPTASSPRRRSYLSPIESVMLSLPAPPVSSVVASGLQSYDPDPARPGSGTQMALRIADRQQELSRLIPSPAEHRMADGVVARLSLSRPGFDVAPLAEAVSARKSSAARSTVLDLPVLSLRQLVSPQRPVGRTQPAGRTRIAQPHPTLRDLGSTPRPGVVPASSLPPSPLTTEAALLGLTAGDAARPGSAPRSATPGGSVPSSTAQPTSIQSVMGRPGSVVGDVGRARALPRDMARLDAVVAEAPQYPVTFGPTPMGAAVPSEGFASGTVPRRHTERRTWKLFSPAKALSLTLLVGSDLQETADPADDKAGILQKAGRAARLALSAPEARAALLDLDDAVGQKGRIGFVPTTFGTLALQQSEAGTSALRIPGSPTRSLIEISLPPRTAAQAVSEVVLGTVVEKPTAPTAVPLPRSTKRRIEKLLSSTPLAAGSSLVDMLAQISGQRDVSLELSSIERLPAALRAATELVKRGSVPARKIESEPTAELTAIRRGTLARRVLKAQQQLVPEFVAVTGEQNTQLRVAPPEQPRELPVQSTAVRPVERGLTSQRAVAAIRSLELISQRLQQPTSVSSGQLTIPDRVEPGMMTRSTLFEPMSAAIEAFAESRLRIQGIASRVSELEAQGGERATEQLRTLETVLSGGGELVALATVAGRAEAPQTAGIASYVQPTSTVARSGETLAWAADLAERAKKTAFASAHIARSAVSPKRRELVDGLVGMSLDFDSATTGPLAHLALRDLAPAPRIARRRAEAGDEALTLPLLAAERASSPSQHLSVGAPEAPLTLVSVLEQVGDQSRWIGSSSADRAVAPSMGRAQIVPGIAPTRAQTARRRATVLSQETPSTGLRPSAMKRTRADRGSEGGVDSGPATARSSFVGRARFDDTAGRHLGPMVSFVDRSSGLPRIIRSESPSRASVAISQVAVEVRTSSSPLEQLAERLALQFIGPSSQAPESRTEQAPTRPIKATRSQALETLSGAGFGVPQLKGAVLVPPAERPAGRTEPSAKVPSLVSRILTEVRASSIATSSPISTALSVLNLGVPAPTRDLSLSPALTTTLDAPVFGVPQPVSSRGTAARSRRRGAGITAADSVGEQVAQVGQSPEVEALGRVAVRATRELTVRAPSKASASRGGESDGWSSVLGAGATQTQGQGERLGASSLGWLQRELSSLVGFDSGYSSGTAVDLQHQPAAVAAAQRLARYLDAEVVQSDSGRDASPQATGRRAEVVRQATPRTHKAKVERTRTRLGQGPKQQRTLTAPFVQGQAIEQARNYVEPWAGASAPASAPGIQPLAKTDSQSGHDGDRAETAGAIASPPRDKLAMMAEQIFSIIKAKLDDEATRYGR